MKQLDWRVAILVLGIALSLGASIAQADAIEISFNSGPSTNSSSTPTTVTFIVSDNDFTNPVGSVFGEFSANGSFLTGSGNVVATAYADNSNALFGEGILLDMATFSSFPYDGGQVPFIATAPYSLTMKFVITLNPNSSAVVSGILGVSDTAVPAPVPEPSSILLLATGVGMTILTTLRRRRRGL